MMRTIIISSIIFVVSVTNSSAQPEIDESVGGIIDANGPVHFRDGSVAHKSKRHHKADKDYEPLWDDNGPDIEKDGINGR